MKRMNLRDVPDDAYAVLVRAAEDNHQSLNAFVVERLVEAAKVAELGAYFASYHPPQGVNVSMEDAVEAVREVRAES